VHGANRLASNSLLECLVFGRRAALAARDEPSSPRSRASVQAQLPPVAAPGLGPALWRDAGLIRNADGLLRLVDAPHQLVRLIAESALARNESRGVHFREDFPAEDERFTGHVVQRPGCGPTVERWS
jgi:L-aspartate oxidase